ncbi:hypothetical protein ACFE04_019126 [Oxalis oulophora]
MGKSAKRRSYPIREVVGKEQQTSKEGTIGEKKQLEIKTEAMEEFPIEGTGKDIVAEPKLAEKIDAVWKAKQPQQKITNEIVLNHQLHEDIEIKQSDHEANVNNGNENEQEGHTINERHTATTDKTPIWGYSTNHVTFSGQTK